MKEKNNPEERPLILLVDDNEEILEFISGDLSEKYTVQTAMDGQQALQLLSAMPVQLVISDIMMDVMDGFELCRRIKSDFEYSHIPVILLTAKNTLQSRIAGLELGADAYIEKPFSPEHLQVQIVNLLANREKLKQYFASLPLTHIRSMAHTRADEAFLEKLNQVIEDHLTDTGLDVEQLSLYMCMSRPTLYRKIKAISDLTPHELINISRLKKAAALLAEGHYKIYEVSEMVGYGSQDQFGRNFLRQFGITPSAYTGLRKEEAPGK
ncbi:response regulator transcription factor [Compostibacter hankyongensis]|uniref:Response regulator transcription factor n=1 Tax=Compostibacter hankyongensis TaxID=1007089 RepID=A0ABP8FMD5_9BACT